MRRSHTREKFIVFIVRFVQLLLLLLLNYEVTVSNRRMLHTILSLRGQIGFNRCFQVVAVLFQERNADIVTGVGDRFHARHYIPFQLVAAGGRTQ